MHQCYNLSLFFSIEQTSIIQIRPVMFEFPTLLKKKGDRSSAPASLQ